MRSSEEGKEGVVILVSSVIKFWHISSISHVEQSRDAFIIWVKALEQLKQVLKLYLCAVSQFSTPDKSKAFSTLQNAR